ncbi:MAG: hypothetical protein IT332_03135 [Ardenticatenales bacterium]|nr:hypothetical protein [Ardenticatenales bacterium]
MAGVKVILVGSGEFGHWPKLYRTPPLLTRVAKYASAYWPHAEVLDEACAGSWDADELRTKLPKWLCSATAEDDLLFVWSGHGHKSISHHWLVTYDTPSANDSGISTTNSVRTDELAAWLLTCRARRIVVILDTCWAGDGGQNLGAQLAESAAATPPTEEKRWLRVVSSARREEAEEGAFLSSMLEILNSGAPPGSLAKEHRWERDVKEITTDQLCAAVNIKLKVANHDHQAIVSGGYGVPGAFFPIRGSRTGLEIPPASVQRLTRHCTGLSSEGSWTEERLANELQRLAPGDQDGPVGYRISRTAMALSAWNLLDDLVGTPGLGAGLDEAWSAMLPPVQRSRAPETHFGYIEQVALFYDIDQSGERLVELVVRTLSAAGEEPATKRLYDWAKSHRLDAKVVDDVIIRTKMPPTSARLIVDFSRSVPAEGVPPELVRGLLLSQGQVEGCEIAFQEPGAVARAIGELVDWAKHRGSTPDHVDVLLPVDLFCVARPEDAQVLERRRFPRKVVAARPVVLHWDQRPHDSNFDQLITFAKAITPNADTSVLWVDPATTTGQELFDRLDADDGQCSSPVIAFSRRPEDPLLFLAALDQRPFVLWVDDRQHDQEALVDEVRRRWGDFPVCLYDEYRDAAKDRPSDSQLRCLRAVWDDADWLVKVVPLIRRVDTHAARL